MTTTASNLINLYKFPLGRCLFALRGVADRARSRGMLQIEQMATRAADEVQQTMSLVQLFQTAPDSMYPAKAVMLDNQVDRMVGAIEAYLEVQMRMYPGEPRALAAERLKQALMPKGVAAITHLSYAEEHEQINVMLEHSESKELQDDILLLPEFSDMLQRLRERNREYGEVLRQVQDVPTRAHVQQVQAKAQEHLAATAALIIGLHGLRAQTPGLEDTADRDHMLEPILQQNEALRVMRRRRRTPVDVDPQTGEELPDSPGADTDTDTDAEP